MRGMNISDELLGMDLFAFLDCDPTATDPEIKSAYRRKALLCHPDKHPDNPNAAEMFKKLKSVVDLLLDQYKRTNYNRQKAAFNSRKMDSEKRAQEELYRKQRMQQESERKQRAEERARQEAYSQQKAQEEFQRQQKAQQESYRKERSRQEKERQEKAESHKQQNEPQGASYRDAGRSSYTPRPHRDIESIAAAALAALNKSHRDRIREQAKRRGMGRSKRPSCFSTNVDPNGRSFWTFPRPTSSSSNPDPNRSSFHQRSTFSNLDPNSPIFEPRTMPGRTI